MIAAILCVLANSGYITPAGLDKITITMDIHDDKKYLKLSPSEFYALQEYVSCKSLFIAISLRVQEELAS